MRRSWPVLGRNTTGKKNNIIHKLNKSYVFQTASAFYFGFARERVKRLSLV